MQIMRAVANWLIGLLCLATILAKAQNYSCPRGCACSFGSSMSCRGPDFGKLTPFHLNPDLPSVISLTIFNAPLLIDVPANAFNTLLDLNSLHLINNGIMNVSSRAFAGLPALKTLSLRGNKLQHLPDDVFLDLRELTDLDLTYNQITRLPLSIEGLIKLKVLRIGNLPLHCSCDLLDLAVNLAQWENSNSEATCASPREVQGKRLAMLGRMTRQAMASTRQLGFYPAGSDQDYYFRNLTGTWPWPHCPIGDIGGRLPTKMQQTHMKQMPARILVAPESLYSVVGDLVEFRCEVEGFPDPQVSWIIPSSRGDEYVQLFNRRRLLVLREAHDYNAGTYTCVAKNDLGSDTRSATMQIIPGSKPRIISSPLAEDNEASLGERHTMKCTARGRPRPKLSWIWEQHNLPRKLSTEGRYIVRMEEPKFIQPQVQVPESYLASSTHRMYDAAVSQAYEEEASIILIIKNITKEDTEGRYLCYSNNLLGISQVSTVMRLKWVPPRRHMMNKTMMKTDSMHAEPDGDQQTTEDEVVKDVIERARVRIDEAVKRTADRLRDPSRSRSSADIASLFRQPSRAALELAKAAEVYEVALEEVTKILRQKDQSFVINQDELPIDNIDDQDSGTVSTLGVQLTTEQLAVLSQLSGCQQPVSADPCTKHLCFHLKYRSIDGKCNNLNNPKWGAALAPFYRLLPPEYENGVNTPVGWNSEKTYFGFPKPSARLVSTTLLANSTMRDKFRQEISAMNEKMMKMKREKDESMGMNNVTDMDKYDQLRDLRQRGLANSRLRADNSDNYIFENQRMAMRDMKLFDEDDKYSGMLMQWGQFLDHDLDFTPVDASTSRFSDGLGCNETCLNDPPCFPIIVPPNDPRIKHRCIGFSRSAATCGSGSTSFLTGRPHFREQINQITSFIDASNVYASDQIEADRLRNTAFDEGKMVYGMTTAADKVLLPFNIQGQVDCQADPEQDFVPCFKAGDHRSNENLGLLTMHTIWLREHNRLAEGLRSINPHWSGDRIYQEAKKIVGAKMQVITYEDWLPKILGPQGMKLLGPYEGYNDNLNPSISNEFATAAFRFGHTLVPPIVFRLDSNWNPIMQGHLELHKAFFAPERILKDGGMDPIIRGLLYHGVRERSRNPPLNSELTEKLFAMAHELALDLAALNVQRGRDHGFPPYTAYAHSFCKLLPQKYPESFDDLAPLITSPDTREKLRQVYGHPGNVDLFVGAVLEDLLPMARVGPTFACIIADQFKRLRAGDRFWYEAPGMFTIAQKAELKRAGGLLSRLICDNADNITEVPRDAFLRPMQDKKDMIKCEMTGKLPRLNLAYWKYCPNSGQGGDDKYTVSSPTANDDTFTDVLIRGRRSVEPESSSASCSSTKSDLESRLAKVEQELARLRKEEL